MERRQNRDFRISFTTDKVKPSHIHQDVELLYVIEGRLRIQVFDKAFELGNEDFMVINSNHRHSWTAEQGASAALCEIHFDYGMILEQLDKKLIFFHCNSRMDGDGRYEHVRGLLSQLLSMCAVNGERTTFSETSLVYSLMDYLAQYFMVDETAGILSKEDLRVEKMFQYLNANYHRSLPLKEMADFMYMAPSSFSRFFKKAIGINFVEYVNQLRLHFALEDLCYTDYSITWIAENHGFTNASAFCRLFKEEYGESPASYRKKFGRREGVPKSSDKEIHRYLKKYARKEAAKTTAGGKRDLARVECSVRQHAAWNNPWNRGMNLGMAYGLLNAEKRQQVKRAREELGFELGKIGGIFSEKFLFRQGHDMHITNYVFLDTVLDFLVEAGIRPVIGLDNKPRGTFKDVSNVMHESRERAPFESLEELLSILDDFLDHVIRRYGRKTVSGWKFECWYYAVDMTVLGLSVDFVDAFSKISGRIKAKIPKAEVGGWGISAIEDDDGQLFSKTMERWGKSGVYPDFISLNLFPYMSYNLESEANMSRRLLNTVEYYRKAVAGCRKKMNDCGFAHVPIYVLEWNTSLSDRNFYNETCGKAALMLQMMTALHDSIECAAYTEITDLGDIYFDTAEALFGGKGLISIFGARKPAYFAMMFLNKMGPYLIYQDGCTMISADGYGGYTILCFNAKRLKYNYYRKEESSVEAGETKSIFEDEKNLEIVFCLNDVENGSYQIREYSMSPGRGCVLDEWIRLGKTEPMDDADYQYLREISQPMRKRSRVTVQQGKLILMQTLSGHEFRLLEISRD